MSSLPRNLGLLLTLAFATGARGAARPPIDGKIEIPRLGVAGEIREGADDDTLRVAVGHIPGTALPGPTGNVALAAHRYGYFKGLRHVRKGDEITVTTPGGIFHYAVDRIEIVEITDVQVLEPTPDPTLTLVTCYPFDYIGAAPQRLIVRAHQTDVQKASRASDPAEKARPDESTGVAPTS
ncbi:MAG TPA: class D sortase [Thermoanaerobaculia bacterium]|jgi:sortase A|nr:class D sortase [Thermoanaerobaculia bacterium]